MSLLNRNRGLYQEQWQLRSLTGRIDKHGNPVTYKQSLSREGAWSCDCGAWKFQRGKLFNGQMVDPDYHEVNGLCKHLMVILEVRNRQTTATAIEQRQTVHVQTEEYDVELVDIELNGRLSGLLNQLS